MNRYPLDPPGYAERVAELLAEGYTNSDAQAIADGEVMQNGRVNPPRSAVSAGKAVCPYRKQAEAGGGNCMCDACLSERRSRAGKVDVLAVMAAVHAGARHVEDWEILAARAAVAELIEAAEQAEYWLSEMKPGETVTPTDMLRVLRRAIKHSKGK